MIPNRPARVAELIKRQLGLIIQQELQDPRLTLASVTNVTLTKDLKQADIWFSVIGDSTAQEKAQEAFMHAQNRIRELLAQKVKLRYMPFLRFHLDKSIEYNAHISEIIFRLKKEEGWDSE